MFGSKQQGSLIFTFILSVILLFLGSCSDRLSAENSPLQSVSPPVITAKLAEVAPPPVIQQLTKSLDQYQPQVRILTPQPDQLLSDTTVNVTLQVQDYPLFEDETLKMGPNLHLILDNEPYQMIYDINQPITLSDLSPGTHTLRVFATTPWHESFKNDGAYAQTTFHIFTKTNDNAPDSNLPLLTYNLPKGNYGAEPILLDFYLTNAPLHIATEPDNPLNDWRIRVTINGESFLLDNWQPIYLKGFEKGGNWVKLEFLDGQGNPIKNAFNDTARLITYNPKGTDTLSKLVRGEISAEVARSIVNPNAPAVNLPPETETEIEVPEEPSITLPDAIEEISPEVVKNLQEEPASEPVETPIEAEPIITPEIEAEPPISKPQETEENAVISEPVLIEKKAEKIETIQEITPPEVVVEPRETQSIIPQENTEDLSELTSTELQLKILESIEKLEKRIDELPTSSPQSLSENSNSPLLESPKTSPSNNIESFRSDLKKRLQKWQELLKISQ